eukprot:692806-Prymnesium_polylepis.1
MPPPSTLPSTSPPPSPPPPIMPPLRHHHQPAPRQALPRSDSFVPRARCTAPLSKSAPEYQRSVHCALERLAHHASKL